MITLTLQSGMSVQAMVLVTLVAVGLVGVCYFLAFGRLKPRQWITLLTLRLLAIVIIVLLLFRPMFTYEKERVERRSVIFLLDTSASMSISDDAQGRTRFELAGERVRQWWDLLDEPFDLHLIEFSERARPLDDVKLLATLSPEGKATSLSRALVAATRVGPKQADIEAILLLSDGVHNSARKPEEIARQLSTTVHTIGVGASLRGSATHRDVQLTGLNCSDTLMLNNKARILASVDGVGLAGRVIRVVLEDDGQALDEVELTLDEIEGGQEIEFEFRPTVKGRHTYTVRVPPLEEERIEENNTRSAVALVVEPGIRVLYLEGTLRAEYGAIVQRFLSKDPDLQFCSLVQTRPNVFLRRSNMEDLALDAIPSDQETFDLFDVFLIGDLDSSYLDTARQAMILNRVRGGAGLIMLGGYHGLGPGGYARTPLGDALPVVLGDREIGQVLDPFLPVLTPDGSRHAVFANIAAFFPTTTGPAVTEGLPPLDGCTRVVGRHPAATVLATCPVEMAGDEEMPILATRPVDEGRTAVFCGDTTRKWQQGPRAMDQDSPFMRFWGQMIRWAAGRSSEVEAVASITAATDKAYYEPEEEILITAVVRDEQGQAATDAVVTAQVIGPAGRADKVDLSVVPGAAGHYAARHTPETAGEHEITVQAKLGELTLKAEQELLVEIGRPYLEFERLDLDDKLLGQLAAETGGRYVHITTADHLIDQLDREQRKERVQMETRLYWPWPMWMLFVVVLTFEWALRRRLQLR